MAPSETGVLQARTGDGLTGPQRAVLDSIARDTWRFFQRDVDLVAHPPLDDLGPGSTRGAVHIRGRRQLCGWSVVHVA